MAAVVSPVPRAGGQDLETTPPVGLGISDGTFTAVANGAASFQIPILVPPGTAGLEPTLAFVYDSRTRETLLGSGWSIDGLPAVTRCPATKAQDGFAGGIKLDAMTRWDG